VVDIPEPDKRLVLEVAVPSEHQVLEHSLVVRRTTFFACEN
jgi:hypothetical protein